MTGGGGMTGGIFFGRWNFFSEIEGWNLQDGILF